MGSKGFQLGHVSWCEDRCQVITIYGAKEETGQAENVEWEGWGLSAHWHFIDRQSKRSLQRILKHTERKETSQGTVVLTLREVNVSGREEVK